MKRIALVLLGLVVLVAGGGFTFLTLKKPAQRPAPDVKVERTPERVARGEYLSEHVFLCVDCHSELDFDKWGVPPKAGRKYVGGFCFNKENVGFPGEVCAQNLTSDPETGLGNWTDGEILRAMREGVDKQGNAIFPMMPYEAMATMSDDDAYAIVAYLRTLPPVKNSRPKGHIDFPVSAIVKFIPQPLSGPVTAPDRSDHVAYGKYLSMACRECHTPIDAHNTLLPGKDFAGGHEFRMPGFTVRSANLTFDETGLGKTTKEQFINLFKVWRGVEAPSVPRANNTLMPFTAFSQMTEEDLGDIYDYLQTVPKQANKVERRPPPALPAKAVVADQAAPAGEAPKADAPAAPAEGSPSPGAPEK